jgi:hypothetical protein
MKCGLASLPLQRSPGKVRFDPAVQHWKPACLTVLAAIAGTCNGLSDVDTSARLSHGPHLFLDDHWIAQSTGIERVICEPERLPDPIVTGPEDKCFQPYVTVLRDPSTKRFRIWYGVPENAGQTHLAYMESDDGIHWKRPHRVLKDPRRIQFGTSIIDEGSPFSEPSKRYKYGFWDEGGLQVAASPDGLDWTTLAPGPVLRHNHDINCIFRDPIRNRYMAIVSSVRAGSTWKGELRIPMQSVSDDLVHWTDPWVVITPDQQDEGETQFYAMGGLIARGPLLIGMLRVLRDDLPAEPGGPKAGLGYTVLAWSYDGKTWQRDRQPFVPRNPKPGSWDHAMTWADCQLRVGDEIFIYYGGYARGHKVERFTERQIGLARMRLDRYIVRVATGKGRILTKPVTFSRAKLTLNAQIQGQVRARILDATGTALKGFDFGDFKPLTGDSLQHPMRWGDRSQVPEDRPVQLEIEIDHGRVFAFNLEQI